MTLFSAAMLLFLVMDPFGNIPLFISTLKHVDERRRQRIITRELLIALLVMVVFLFGGHYLLSVLRISEPALTAAGGMVLFLIAIKMVFPSIGQSSAEEAGGEPFVVPLAVPYVAGPSAISVVLLISSQEPNRWPEWLAALVVAWFASGLIIALSGVLAKVLGNKVLVAIERLMGMLLVAIAIQMIMTGITQFISRT